MTFPERCPSMKVRAIITGRGVHDVGYRLYLLERALDTGFQRFYAKIQVQNGAEQVVVQYEGEPGQVDALGSIIREEHAPGVDIEHIAFEACAWDVVPVTDYLDLLIVEQLSLIAPL